MKKTPIVAAVVLIIGLAVAGMAVLRSWTGQAAASEISERAAGGLQAKIDAIKKASEVPGHTSEEVEVFETELESYVLFHLKDDIPATLDAFDVQLTPGAVAADTRMTFSANSTGNPMIDVLLSGTHNLFVKGSMSAKDGTGKFTLEQVRLDGIPVPTILVEGLVARYVKPKYPDVDLNSPFEMPWGIESLTISPAKVLVVY